MSKNKTRTKDKYRVVYNDTQRIELENEFRLNEYIAIPRKQEIAHKLQLSERQIKIWFQNRRAKKRKQQKRKQSAVTTTVHEATTTTASTTTILKNNSVAHALLNTKPAPIYQTDLLKRERQLHPQHQEQQEQQQQQPQQQQQDQEQEHQPALQHQMHLSYQLHQAHPSHLAQQQHRHHHLLHQQAQLLPQAQSAPPQPQPPEPQPQPQLPTPTSTSTQPHTPIAHPRLNQIQAQQATSGNYYDSANQYQQSYLNQSPHDYYASMISQQEHHHHNQALSNEQIAFQQQHRAIDWPQATSPTAVNHHNNHLHNHHHHQLHHSHNTSQFHNNLTTGTQAQHITQHSYLNHNATTPVVHQQLNQAPLLHHSHYSTRCEPIEHRPNVGDTILYKDAHTHVV